MADVNIERLLESERMLAEERNKNTQTRMDGLGSQMRAGFERIEKKIENLPCERRGNDLATIRESLRQSEKSAIGWRHNLSIAVAALAGFSGLVLSFLRLKQ